MLFCRDLCTFWKTFGKESALLGQKEHFLGKKFTITWYENVCGHFCTSANFYHPAHLYALLPIGWGFSLANHSKGHIWADFRLEKHAALGLVRTFLFFYPRTLLSKFSDHLMKCGSPDLKSILLLSKSFPALNKSLNFRTVSMKLYSSFSSCEEWPRQCIKKSQ